LEVEEAKKKDTSKLQERLVFRDIRTKKQEVQKYTTIIFKKVYCTRLISRHKIRQDSMIDPKLVLTRLKSPSSGLLFILQHIDLVKASTYLLKDYGRY